MHGFAILTRVRGNLPFRTLRPRAFIIDTLALNQIMDSTSPTTTAGIPADAPQTDFVAPALAERRSSLALLLGSIDEAPSVSYEDDTAVRQRLGIAASLFRALRAKHAPTANHCLRVALRCSFVAHMLDVTGEELDHLEIASLLHDIGKIGVPDSILTKPAPLSADEREVMSRQRNCGLEILSSSCFPEEIIEIIRLAALSYSEAKAGSLPLGARILNISDAFDAMTTDHVYRPAMSRERAVAELFENSGSQFDPGLVREFAKLSSHTEAEINQHVQERWSQSLSPSSADALWQLKQPIYANVGSPSAESIFQQRLLDAMHDGVIFIDSSGRILLWNHGAERLTGISPQSVYEKAWTPSLLDMRDEEGNLICDDRCPVKNVIRTGVQSLRRMTITHVNFKKVSVDIHVIPVTDERSSCYGATLLMHDASSETNLEERVQNLHEQATTDPLTGVHNRAEFERVFQRLVQSSLDTGTPCSIVICDIDRFKQVNDVYGHQAGDQALVNFATLLQSCTRPGDLVARYGGEEFVLLCAGCDNSTAARRAEQIRRELAHTPQEALNGRCMTASFGVTQLQLGDTTETMLRRSDRALYQAKDSGRNRVIQLGAGIVDALDDAEVAKKASWFSWLRRKDPEAIVNRTLVANVPIPILAEKIRGFISDHYADIVRIEDDFVELKVDTRKISSAHLPEDIRHATFTLEIRFREQEERSSQDSERRTGSRTMIDVVIKSTHNSEKRNIEERGNQVLSSLKSYLIAQDYFAE